MTRIEADSKRPWCGTYYSSRPFYFDDVSENEYLLHDIALGLAATNRYGGHTLFPYSVAQHSVLMAEKALEETFNVSLGMDCLFHDAPEAYIGDMRGPLKGMIPEFNRIERDIDRAIRQEFGIRGLPPAMTVFTMEYDRRILLDEKKRLMHKDAGPKWGIETDGTQPLGVRIEEWTVAEAESRWLQCFYKMVRVSK